MGSMRIKGINITLFTGENTKIFEHLPNTPAILCKLILVNDLSVDEVTEDTELI